MDQNTFATVVTPENKVMLMMLCEVFHREIFSFQEYSRYQAIICHVDCPNMISQNHLLLDTELTASHIVPKYS